MLNRFQRYIAMIIVSLGLATHAQQGAPLRLEKKIELPGVAGRIDHMSADVKNQRLFVAALGNNTLEVVDLQNGKRVHTIPGLAEPQGIVYLAGENQLSVANGKDGTFRIFDGSSFNLLKTISLGDDADNARFDAKAGKVYVGYGSGALAVLDSKGNKIGNIALDAHPESFQLEKDSARVFVNLPGSKKIAVVDRNRSAVTTSWTTGDATANFPMALDEAHQRLFVVCRKPAKLIVLDTAEGKIAAQFPTVADSDDIFFDSSMKRVYVSGGEGAIVVYQQEDPDHYKEITRVTTRSGARTSLFVPELGRLYLALRAQGSDPAAIWVYEVGR